MKGKIAFVLGAAVGYVLGTRAGRERYEQIKRGAEAVWNTAPVQRGVDAAKGVAQKRVDELKVVASRAGKNAVAALLRDDSSAGESSSEARSESATGGDSAQSKSSPTRNAAASKQSSSTAKKSSGGKAKAGDDS